MRTTWIILLIMVLAGAVMYYFAKRPKAAAAFDTIRVIDSTDTVHKKIKVFFANNPTEVHYTDTIGWQQDSVPLKAILDSARSDTFDKRYTSATLLINYNKEFFFDLEFTKPDSLLAYNISFRVQPAGNSYVISGTVDNKKDYIIQFKGPMLKLYKEFLISYNHKLPPVPADSTLLASPPVADTTAMADSTRINTPKPTKTVTILRK